MLAYPKKYAKNAITMGHSTNKIKRELPRISIKVELAFILVYWKLPHSSISFKQVKEAGLKLTSRHNVLYNGNATAYNNLKQQTRYNSID
jgi:hypothetical protein